MPLQAPRVTNQAAHQLSLSDLVARLNPDGTVAKVAEILSQRNEILSDIPYVTGNLPTGHRFSVRTSLPKAYWKMMNRGVPTSKSSVAMMEETFGKLQAQSKIDKDELKLNNNSKAFRFLEEKSFIEALNQGMTEALFYNDSRVHPEGFMGLAPRYDHLVPETDRFDPNCVDICKNVLDAGGTGDHLTSIWLIGWSTDTVFGIVPQGEKVGIDVEDKGEQKERDEFGNDYFVMQTVYSWTNGLAIKDPRYVVRIANVDAQELLKGKGMGTGDLKAEDSYNLILLIEKAINLIPSRGDVHLCMYMNADVLHALNVINLRSNTQVVRLLDGMDQFGRNVSWNQFIDVPIRRVDKLTNLEKQLVEVSTLSTYSGVTQEGVALTAGAYAAAEVAATKAAEVAATNSKAKSK